MSELREGRLFQPLSATWDQPISLPRTLNELHLKPAIAPAAQQAHPAIQPVTHAEASRTAAIAWLKAAQTRGVDVGEFSETQPEPEWTVGKSRIPVRVLPPIPGQSPVKQQASPGVASFQKLDSLERFQRWREADGADGARHGSRMKQQIMQAIEASYAAPAPPIAPLPVAPCADYVVESRGKRRRREALGDDDAQYDMVTSSANVTGIDRPDADGVPDADGAPDVMPADMPIAMAAKAKGGKGKGGKASKGGSSKGGTSQKGDISSREGSMQGDDHGEPPEEPWPYLPMLHQPEDAEPSCLLAMLFDNAAMQVVMGDYEKLNNDVEPKSLNRKKGYSRRAIEVLGFTRRLIDSAAAAVDAEVHRPAVHSFTSKLLSRIPDNDGRDISKYERRKLRLDFGVATINIDPLELPYDAEEMARLEGSKQVDDGRVEVLCCPSCQHMIVLESAQIFKVARASVPRASLPSASRGRSADVTPAANAGGGSAAVPATAAGAAGRKLMPAAVSSGFYRPQRALPKILEADPATADPDTEHRNASPPRPRRTASPPRQVRSGSLSADVSERGDSDNEALDDVAGGVLDPKRLDFSTLEPSIADGQDGVAMTDRSVQDQEPLGDTTAEAAPDFTTGGTAARNEMDPPSAPASHRKGAIATDVGSPQSPPKVEGLLSGSPTSELELPTPTKPRRILHEPVQGSPMPGDTAWDLSVEFWLRQPNKDNKYLHVEPKVIKDSDGPIHILDASAPIQLELRIKTDTKECRPDRCAQISIAETVLREGYPALIKERREIHAKLVANKDATRDFIIRDTQIEGDEMVVIADWPEPTVRFGITAPGSLVLVPLLFSIRLDLFSRPFVLKALLAFQVFEMKKPSKEVKAYLKLAQSKPICMPKGTYRVYTRPTRPESHTAEDEDASDLDSVRTPLDFKEEEEPKKVPQKK